MMKTAETYLKSLSPALFWDVNISTIDPKNNIQFIIERVY